MQVELKIEGWDERELTEVKEILIALLSSGGLTGVKNGKTIIHFNEQGIFQRIQLDYFPWNRRSFTNKP